MKLDHLINNVTFSLQFIISIICIIKLPKVSRYYKPFCYYIIVSFITEMLSELSIILFHSNAIVSNIYVLWEFLILIILLTNLKKHIEGRNKARNIFLFGLIVWIADILVIHSIKEFSPYYRIFYALTLIYLSVDHINYTMVHERKNVIKNVDFLISITMLIYFTFRIIVEVFYIVEEAISPNFQTTIMSLHSFVNLLCFVNCFIITLIIPKRNKLSLSIIGS